MQRKRNFRVIVDTNCWISFLIGRRLSRLVDLLSNERVQLVICDELLAEIQEVTCRPKFAKYFPKKEVESLIEFMQIIGERFEPTQDVKPDFFICPITQGLFHGSGDGSLTHFCVYR
jgi:putative PIN family toxin of toxin-antitoxin system